MRLYDTASRQLRELPAPPGPVRIYVCGPTVYQRIHIDGVDRRATRHLVVDVMAVAA